MQTTVLVGGSTSPLSQSILDSLNVEQARKENRANLDKLGGIDGLIGLVGVNLTTGLSHEQVKTMRVLFGNNEYPEAPLESYGSLFIEALADSTLLILIAAASVSLVLGILTEPENGWIEGAAIFIAVFLVSNIAAANDYSKQLQFRALEHSSAEDERSSVYRDGFVERVNPIDIVVGDILVLQVCFNHHFSCRRNKYYNKYFFKAGEKIPADAVMLDQVTVQSNESSLTGEPDDLRKNRDGDCFLLSSCLITEGEDCKAVVIGIGIHSQWGKIKANLVSEAVNTPLQDKLEDMAKAVRFFLFTFILNLSY